MKSANDIITKLKETGKNCSLKCTCLLISYIFIFKTLEPYTANITTIVPIILKII
jgi:hypothetical protein